MIRLGLLFVYLFVSCVLSYGVGPSTILKAQSPNEIGRPLLLHQKDAVYLLANAHNTVQINGVQYSHHGRFITISPYNTTLKQFETALQITGDVTFGGAVQNEDSILIFGSCTKPLLVNGEALLKTTTPGLFLLSLEFSRHKIIPTFVPDLYGSALAFTVHGDISYLLVSHNNEKMSLIVTDGETQTVTHLFETEDEDVHSMEVLGVHIEDGVLVIHGEVHLKQRKITSFKVGDQSSTTEMGKIISFELEVDTENPSDKSLWKFSYEVDKIYKTMKDEMVYIGDDIYFIREERTTNFGLENYYLFLEVLSENIDLFESSPMDDQEDEVFQKPSEEDSDNQKDEDEREKEEKEKEEKEKEEKEKKEKEKKEKEEKEKEEKEKEEKEKKEKEKEEKEKEEKEKEEKEKEKEEKDTTGEDFPHDTADQGDEKEEKEKEEKETVGQPGPNPPEPDNEHSVETKTVLPKKADSSSINSWAITALCFLVLGGIGYMLWRNSRSSPEGLLGLLKSFGTQGKDFIQRKFPDKNQTSEEFASMKQKEFYA